MKSTNTNHEDSFIEHYNEHSDGIFRLCFFKTGDRELATDLVQDTFMRVWDTLQKGKEVENLKAFIYQVAKNAIIDYYRKKKTSSLDSLLEEGFDEQGDDNREKHADVFEAKQLMQHVHELDDMYRDILLLRYVEDFSIEEIAEHVGEEKNNISVRIHRALKKLETIIEEKQKEYE
ncbi:MAG: RNA polymerase sigma-70 factor (ECF subfamily) [Flavobacteriaceae bacterium]|jgi:RNA polymerase sigma-70 factor (ECF subfamily)